MANVDNFLRNIFGNMKIAIAADHAGYELKMSLSNWLKEKEYQILDFGTFGNESVDYPDFALPASESVASGEADLGILICGTGIGMSMVANKIRGIRAANCTTPYMAKMAREHNNANILTLGSRISDFETAKEIVTEFLSNEFLAGRHQVRVEKIGLLTGAK
jgi:ribose 5-phosphate isomerase B